MTPEEFKKHFNTVTRTTLEEQQTANPDWQALAAIHSHHQKNTARLEDVAYLKVKWIQRMNEVHSVRWRVKSPDHLIDKIIRKLADPKGKEKYEGINVENYVERVTDLVGLRALHLFKEDSVVIHRQIEADFTFDETPVIYVRNGDTLPAAIQDMGIPTRDHNAGYRSIHYILKSARDKGEPDLVELQVRSLYEEAWSEIDHRIRYPNFSDDPSIFAALMMLNRFSGGADEMTSFIRELAKSIDAKSKEIDGLIADLRKSAQNNGELSQKIDRLVASQRNPISGGAITSASIESLTKDMRNYDEMRRKALGIGTVGGMVGELRNPMSGIISSNFGRHPLDKK